MGLRSIKKIVETEKEAETKKQEAKQKAKTIIENTEKTKEEYQKRYNEQLKEQQKELQKQKTEENLKTITKIQAEKDDKIRRLQETQKNHIPEAVEKIYEKIIKI